MRADLLVLYRENFAAFRAEEERFCPENYICCVVYLLIAERAYRRFFVDVHAECGRLVVQLHDRWLGADFKKALHITLLWNLYRQNTRGIYSSASTSATRATTARTGAARKYSSRSGST